MNLGISGISGRMGRVVLETALEKGHRVVCACDSPASAFFGRDAGTLIDGRETGVLIGSVDGLFSASPDAIVDFSAPEAAMRLLELAVKNSVPLVSGTTGLGDKENLLIKKAAEKIPLVFSPNMSVGVNLLFKLAEFAAAKIGGAYDIEIFEAHHNKKKDAPSGTALRLGEIIRNNSRAVEEVHGRSGITGERRADELGIMAMRGGDIVGEHTVFFVGPGERLELTHRAGSRRTFASGAVLAAEFLKGRPAGAYSMFDVLGI